MNKNDYIEIDIDAQIDLIGHLRYGSLSGIISIPKEDLDTFKKNPEKYILYNGYDSELDLSIDSYEIDNFGELNEVNYNIREVK